MIIVHKNYLAVVNSFSVVWILLPLFYLALFISVYKKKQLSFPVLVKF